MTPSGHPVARIRRTTLVAGVALVLVLRDLWRIHGWAGQARDIELDMRGRHARELEDIDQQHLERMRELRIEIEALRDRDFRPAPPAADVESDAIEIPIDKP